MNIQDCGNLIKTLRKENNLTQKELADKLFISDKTISKWERGVGLPDISIINDVANIFSVSVETLLFGEINVNSDREVTLKNISFYVCKNCNNVITSTKYADIICCDKKLVILEENKSDDMHNLLIEETDSDFYISTNHEMTKEHFISFVAIVKGESINIIKTFAEWELNIRQTKLRFSKVYYYCVKDGLFYQYVK